MTGLAAPSPKRVATGSVAARYAAGRAIARIGHPIHADADPRIKKFLSVASALCFAGRYVTLALTVANVEMRAADRAGPRK